MYRVGRVGRVGRVVTHEEDVFGVVFQRWQFVIVDGTHLVGV